LGSSSDSNTDMIIANELTESESDERSVLAGSEWKITTFAKTPLMSTYLVAFANGHLDFLETTVDMPLSGKTLPLRIYGVFKLSEQSSELVQSFTTNLTGFDD
jgi:aminopeptidase N